jgi:hypothetical protein
MEINNHPIIDHLNLLTQDNRHLFLFLTKLIFEYQKENDLNIFHDLNENFYYNNYFNYKNYQDIYLNKHKSYIIREIYQTNYSLYLEILHFIQETKRIKRLPPILNGLINNDKKPNFIRFINTIILFNLIKIRLRNKSLEDIISLTKNNSLVYKLRDIHNNLDVWLGLRYLMTFKLTDNTTKNDYLMDYNYENIFWEKINEFQYHDAIYDAFDSFV